MIGKTVWLQAYFSFSSSMHQGGTCQQQLELLLAALAEQLLTQRQLCWHGRHFCSIRA
jgi:hypothetical protein